MKVKALLLSFTMLLSFFGAGILGTNTADRAAVNETNETDITTTEEENREDASKVGETSEGQSTSKEQTSTEEVPTVIVPSTTNNSVDEPEIDTTKGKFKITMKPEKTGWYNDTAKIMIDVENQSSLKQSPKISKVEAKQGSNGTWIDITDDMYIEINENCTVYVKITDSNDNEYEKSKLIKCFDMVAPTLNAAVNEGLLTVMTYDTESGVEAVYINGYEYTPDEHGIVSIRLEKFDATYQNFYVYALDMAGNPSTVYTIVNPYWSNPNETTDDDENTNPADALPDNASAKTTGESKAEITSVTDEDGEDITNDVKGKQFYSIVTADGQQYFLIVDMTAAQDKSQDTENTAYAGAGSSSRNNSSNNGTVYFLTSVSNQNLLNFTNDGEQTLPHNSVATANGIDPYTMTPIGQDDTIVNEEIEDTEENVKEEKAKISSNTIIYIIVIVIVGAGVVLFKLKGNKKGKPEQNDDTMYGDTEEEEDSSLEELNEEEE
ncbi:MAG: DUF4366 domain-containing protein [Lachnospiraceae bacterium]|nr:DUF4366 domain-containing protein [Lachnospiraceae bacterium]MBQ9199051.1 DUF4366 domain-containing protein [Lachnospiraceae bacterium]